MRNSLWRKEVIIITILLLFGTSYAPTIFGNINILGKNNGASNDRNVVTENIALNSKGDLVLDLSFEEPIIEKITLLNHTYDRVRLPDLPNTDTPNEPNLPIKPLQILLPQDYTVEFIDITVEGKTYIGDGFDIELGEEPISFSDDFIQDSPRPPDTYNDYRPEPPSSYDSGQSYPLDDEGKSQFDTSKPFPTNHYTTVGTYNFRGYSILILTLFPLHYTQDTGEIYYYKHCTLTIQTKFDTQSQSLFRGLPRDAEEVKHKVMNPEIIHTYTTVPKQQKRSTLVDPADSYQYVIITSEIFSTIYGPYSFQNLIDLKTRKGINATLVNIEDITVESAYWNTTHPLFNDTQAQIRNFITDAYLNWETDYILFGGDADAYYYNYYGK